MIEIDSLFPIIGLIFIAFLSFFIVNQQTVIVIQRFGKFVRIANPGLNIKIPIIETIAGHVNLRVQQLDVEVETKTLDNVFVRVTVSVQYCVNPEKIYAAFYRLQNPEQQITSYVFDVIRAKVPTIKLDDVFEKKDDVANAVRLELSDIMDNFGYEIIKALVTDIDPDKKVKDSMNEINAAQRMRVAASEKGEAERILKVKIAQANAESQALQGKGVADQRTAIIDGLRDSISGFQKEIEGSSSSDIMNIVLMTQYFDTLKEIGSNSNNNTILLPHSPGAMNDILDQIRNTIISSNEIKNGQKKSKNKSFYSDSNDFNKNKVEDIWNDDLV